MSVKMRVFSFKKRQAFSGCVLSEREALNGGAQSVRAVAVGPSGILPDESRQVRNSYQSKFRRVASLPFFTKRDARWPHSRDGLCPDACLRIS